MMQKKGFDWRGILGGLIIVIIFVVIALLRQNVYNREMREWQEKFGEQVEKQKEAVLIRRVSEQMEEVAYQQKEISDRQRTEAVKQRIEAEYLRRVAETETKKSVRARQETFVAYQEMEQQKSRAEQHRVEAIFAREQADTLAGLALGRSLGALSIARYQAGELELSGLLAWWAWKFTRDNGGDCFLPEIFNALSLNDRKDRILMQLQGAIRSLFTWKNGKNLNVLGAGESGEVVLWQELDNQQGKMSCICECGLDLRKVLVTHNGDSILAMTYNGELLVIPSFKNKESQIVRTELRKVCGLEYYRGRYLLASYEGRIEVWGNKERSDAIFYTHPIGITTFTAGWNGVLVGDEYGQVSVVDTKGEVECRLKDNEKVRVTALACQDTNGWLAVGYENGIVLVFDRNGLLRRRLAIHLSGVTSLDWEENRLISVGYDGCVRLWDVWNEDHEPVTLAQFSGWLYDVVVDTANKRVICAGQSGEVYMISLSPDDMAARIRKKVKRELTEQEWERLRRGRL